MLKARHTRAADGRPLVILQGLPFNGEELTPQQLEALARQLKEVAIDAFREAGQHKRRA